MISIISVAYFRSCLLPKKGVICNTALRLETKEFFANLVEAKDPETGEGLTERQIVSETGSLLLAGRWLRYKGDHLGSHHFLLRPLSRNSSRQ